MKKAIKDMTLSEIKEEIREHQVNPDENYVFISYAHKDDRVVYPKVLEWIRSGYNIYIDTDFENHGSDENWVSIMIDRIRDASCVMAVCFRSEHYCFSYASLIELLTMKSRETLDFRKGFGAENPDTPIDIINLDNQPVSEGKKFSAAAEADYRDTYFPQLRKNCGSVFLATNPLEESSLVNGLETLYDESQAQLKITILKAGYKKGYKNFYPAIAMIVNEWFKKNNLNGNTKDINSPGVLARFAELEVHKFANEAPEKIPGGSEPAASPEAQPNAPEIVPVLPTEQHEETAPAQATYRSKNAFITQLGDREFLLHKGALIRKNTAASCSEATKRFRSESMENGDWKDMGDHYLLQCDKQFKSLSGAAGYITGSNVNGNQYWDSTKAEAASVQTSAPTPAQPTPAPAQPVPTPAQPAPAPAQPAPAPAQPVPTPAQPAPTPAQPTPAPAQPVSAPAGPEKPAKKTEVRVDFIPEPVTPVAKTPNGNVTLGEIRRKMASDQDFCRRLGSLRKNDLPFGGKSFMDYAMAAVLGGCNEVKKDYQVNYYDFCVASADKKEGAKVTATWTWPSNARKTIGYVGSGIIKREINTLFEGFPETMTVNDLMEQFEACREEAYITKKNNMVLLALSELIRVYAECQ